MTPSSLDLDGHKQKKIKMDLRQYIVPMVSIAIFIGMMIWGIVPAVKQIIQRFDDLELLNIEINKGNEEVIKLEKIAQEKVSNSELIERLDSVIPMKKTEVIAFHNKVTELAEENFIEIEEIVAGEKILVDSNYIVTDEDSSFQGLSIVQIPLQLKLVGEVPDFESFLKSIYSGNDFIVVTQMELKNSKKDEETIMNLVLSKYQYLPIIKNDPYLGTLLKNVPSDEVMNVKVLEFVTRKSDRL